MNTLCQQALHPPVLDQSPLRRRVHGQLQPVDINSDSINHVALSRRSMLLAASILQVPLSTVLPASASQQFLQRIELPAGPEVPLALRKYFAEAVDEIAAKIGPGFAARLVVYGVTSVMPSGVPGNPSRASKYGINMCTIKFIGIEHLADDGCTDYSKGSSERCGLFNPQSPRPYQLCPLPGGTPADPTARDCCRHYAFAVPYSRVAFAVEDRISTIVVSPRIARLPENHWKGILAHELGHAVDFYLFGKRYRLRNNNAVGPLSTEILEILEEIDKEEDPEFRADKLGELFILGPRGQKLCYDPVLTLQTLVESSSPVSCDGDGSSVELMRHYTHAPLQGSVDKSLL